MKKPELLISAGSAEEAKRYFEAGADAVLIGDYRFGLRLGGEVTTAELAELMPWVRRKGAKLYAAINNILDNASLPALDVYLRQLAEVQIDGAVFGDPAVILAARAAYPDLKLHWNAEMTSTNFATARYWNMKGAIRMVAARELNLEEVLEIAKQLQGQMEVQVQVHGITNIYHSKRNLLHNYKEHQGHPQELAESEIGLGKEEGLFLIEQERPDERYPIYEDVNGTHIMSSDDMCMLDSLHELMEGGIDSFKVESLLKSPEYNETVVRAYRHVIDAYTSDPEDYVFQEEWLEPIRALQDPRRELSYGFFFKEQVY